VLTDVYQSTFKVKDHVGLAANEAYVWHFWGHYFFVPVLLKRFPLRKWCWRGLLGRRDEEARWAAIHTDTSELATCIRRMARLLWMLHLDYTEVRGRGHIWHGLPAPPVPCKHPPEHASALIDASPSLHHSLLPQSFAEGILAQLRATYPPHLSQACINLHITSPLSTSPPPSCCTPPLLQSFAEGIAAQLRAAFPPHLSRTSLAEALGRALKELLQDFPDYTHIVIDPFQEFNRLVDE
jgi:hypothetical protein